MSQQVIFYGMKQFFRPADYSLQPFIKINKLDISIQIRSTLNIFLSSFYLIFFFKTEANCDSTSLSSTISGIVASIDSTQVDIDRADDTKKDLRIAIDCRNNTGTRPNLFEYYEELCKQTVFMKNVMTDLKIKVEILQRELQRCNNRSKIVFFFS